MTHYAKNEKRYTPKGIKTLFEQAVKGENGNIESVLKKREHQKLRELWYASFLALSMKKWLKKEFYLAEPNSDSPDVLLLDLNNQNGFGVEIMELFFYNQPTFDGNHKRLAKTIWDKKALKQLQKSHLLIVSRLNEENFNITTLVQEMQKLAWENVERIWFGIYHNQNLAWTFFEIYQFAQFNDIANISFSMQNKEDMKLYY